MEEVKAVLQLVATYGLPIVLTCWFVFRLDGILTKLVATLTEFIFWLRAREEERCKREMEIKQDLKETARTLKAQTETESAEIKRTLKEAAITAHEELEEKAESIKRAGSETADRLGNRIAENNTLIAVLGAKLGK
jgi:biopolymer transport protein ExbB/TolQ